MPLSATHYIQKFNVKTIGNDLSINQTFRRTSLLSQRFKVFFKSLSYGVTMSHDHEAAWGKKSNYRDKNYRSDDQKIRKCLFGLPSFKKTFIEKFRTGIHVPDQIRNLRFEISTISLTKPNH